MTPTQPTGHIFRVLRRPGDSAGAPIGPSAAEKQKAEQPSGYLLIRRPQVAHTQEGGGAKERHQVDASLAIRDAIIYSSPLCAEACQCGRPPRPPRSEDFKRASPTAAALAAGGHSGGACTPDAADRESGPGPGWALEEGPLLLPAVVAPLVDDARRLLIPVGAFSNTHNPHFHSRPAQDGAVSHSSRH